MSASSTWADMRDTVWPRTRSLDDRLPPLLVLLTLVSGLVDAASYLSLGHVFVANMTGNVVFLGFALAGASGFSIGLSLVALGAFLVGGLAGGRLAVRLSERRLQLLRTSTALQFLPVAAAVTIAAVAGDPLGRASQYVVVAALAMAMGLQNAAVRRLGVPELTTTVLTMTLTDLAAGSRIGRRLTAVLAMFVGALIGALLTIHVGTVASLAAVAGLLVVIAGATIYISRTDMVDAARSLTSCPAG